MKADGDSEGGIETSPEKVVAREAEAVFEVEFVGYRMRRDVRNRVIS